MADTERGRSVIVISGVFGSLATVAVGLRLWARRIKRRPLAADDWLIIFALVFSWGLGILGILAVAIGDEGRHIDHIPPSALVNLEKIFFAAPLFWAFATCFFKLSVLFFYIDVFYLRWFRRICWVVIVITICYCTATFLESFVTCRPLNKTWDPTVPGTCGNQKSEYLSTAIINIIIDTTIIALPMPIVWKLKLPLIKKLALTGIFCVGFFIVAMTAIRLNSIVNLNYEDFSYSSFGDDIWGELEVYLGITNACLPIIQPVLVKFHSTATWIKMYVSSRRGSSDSKLATTAADGSHEERHLGEKSQEAGEYETHNWRHFGVRDPNSSVLVSTDIDVFKEESDAERISGDYTRQW